MAAEVGSELEATVELGLGAGEVALVYKGGRESEMTLGHERPVVDLLGGGDAAAKDLDATVRLPLVVSDEHG